MALSPNKFLGNHSAGPPGSKQLSSSNVQGSTVEQPTLALPSFADLLPKNQVANSSTYASIAGRSSRRKSPPREEYSLFTSDKTLLIFKAGTAAHSVFYSVPKRLQSLQPLCGIDVLFLSINKINK
ncbi:hypothetical protein G6F37_013522 [Rhizopus arrhizus]|nr:hypothetical protein G6F38_013080 [Rhizopus arrhizus]KAG1137472.1 hypothetical protein G6F37_013522 [Rhizopus arrhizus]